MNTGRKVAVIGLAAMAVCGAAGTALAASGSSAHAASTHTASVTSAANSTQWPLAKTTMPVIAKRLGVSEKQMIVALDDMKAAVIDNPKVNKTNVRSVEIKTLYTELPISGAAATWVVDEIEGGYVSTRLNWGF